MELLVTRFCIDPPPNLGASMHWLLEFLTTRFCRAYVASMHWLMELLATRFCRVPHSGASMHWLLECLTTRFSRASGATMHWLMELPATRFCRALHFGTKLHWLMELPTTRFCSPLFWGHHALAYGIHSYKILQSFWDWHALAYRIPDCKILESHKFYHNKFSAAKIRNRALVLWANLALMIRGADQGSETASSVIASCRNWTVVTKWNSLILGAVTDPWSSGVEGTIGTT